MKLPANTSETLTAMPPPLTDIALLARFTPQTAHLSQLIPARVYHCTDPGSLPEHCPDLLILIDCQSFTPPRIHQILEKLETQGSFRAALLNAPDHAETGKLAMWPQIKGVFPVTTSDPLLLQGLDEIARGRHWLPRELTHTLLEWCRQPPRNTDQLKRLTRREVQMLRYLALGFTNSQIAAETHISEHTVKTHLYNVFKKIDVSNRLQACNWAKTQLL